MAIAVNVKEREPLSPGVPVPNDIRAAILIEAAWIGDLPACEKFGITQRTLQRWRRRVSIDDVLATAIEQKQKAFEDRWLEDLDLSLGQAIRTVGACARAVEGDARASKNPAIIHELALAVKMLADVKLSNKIINARLSAMERDRLPLAETDENRLLPGETEIAPGVYVTMPSDVETPTGPADPSLTEDAVEAEESTPEIPLTSASSLD